jgi:hypothetical protein
MRSKLLIPISLVFMLACNLGKTRPAAVTTDTGTVPTDIPAYEIPVNSAVVPSVPADVKARIIQAYQENFALNLTSPIIGKKERQGVTTDPWVSTAYIEDYFYQVDLYPDGRVEAFSRPIPNDGGIPPARSGDEKQQAFTACRPAGNYRLLFVFLDYGNLGLTEVDVLTALTDATSDINELFTRVSAAAGEKSPILQMGTVGVVVPYNVEPPNNALTPTDFASMSGEDISQFDMLVQVELDSANRTRAYWEAQSGAMQSFAYANGSCGVSPTTNDIWLSVDAADQLHGPEGRLFDTVLAHEVFHLFGYPGTHDWMCGDGTDVDASDQCSALNFPSVMLSWVDSDGDGVVEILDPTPYGMQP